MDSIEEKEIEIFGKKMSIGMIGLIATGISTFYRYVMVCL